ncbi:lysylphosphatidylglycerol synthase domain-containing protein [Saccharophagus degradans]|uniref:lysylphosphatidylglycerol synthase domain-containing protein n=1 Tax=Saccharophagus degradans TaxID=86304 RepID=UPI0002FB8C7D|nr:lysylphosphatidylglycerol synthase domain-containing protein [Saccharophagus degradans]
MLAKTSPPIQLQLAPPASKLKIKPPTKENNINLSPKLSWTLKLFYLASLVGVLYFLHQINLTAIPEIKSYTLLGVSFTLLMAGHLADAQAWKSSIPSNNIKYVDAYTSANLSILGKYIPGKIWMLIGRGAIIHKEYNLDINTIGKSLVKYQVATLLAGATVSLFLFAIFLFNKSSHSPPNLILTIGCLIVIILCTTLAYRLTRSSSLLCAGSATWILWGAGYFCLVGATTSSPPPAILAAVFGASAIIGILTLIAPGGLGAREGAMVSLLLILGYSNQDAIAIAILARIWFFTSELSLFISALTIQYLKRPPLG